MHKQILNGLTQLAVIMLMLSLIVTAMVQVISTLTDLRGRNLTSGLHNLLKQIEPGFRKPLGGSTIAEHIAEIVVKHPSVANAGSRAKAIGQRELIRVLRELCSESPATIIDGTVKTKLKQLLDERVPGGPETVAAAQVVAQQPGAKLPGQEAQVKAAIDTTFATVSRLEQGRSVVRHHNAESTVRYCYSQSTCDYRRDFRFVRARAAGRFRRNPAPDS